MKKHMTLLMVILFFSLPQFAIGQIKSLERGVELEKLNFLIGTWELSGTANTRAGKKTAQGYIKYEWVLDNIWLQETTVVTISDVVTVHQLKFITFDAALGKYTGTVFDNLSSNTYPFVEIWLDKKTRESILEIKDNEDPERNLKLIETQTELSDTQIKVVQNRVIGKRKPMESYSFILKKLTAKKKV